MATCNKCGGEIREWNQFCPSCGEPIQTEDEVSEETEVDITNPPREEEMKSESSSDVSVFQMVVGTAFWIIVGIVIGWFMRQHKFQKDAEELFRNMDQWEAEMNRQIENDVNDYVDDYVDDYFSY